MEDSIAHLAQNGREVEAVTLASHALGMSAAQAKDFVAENASPTSYSRNKL